MVIDVMSIFGYHGLGGGANRFGKVSDEVRIT